ncbi:MAG: hypothetical protein LBL13_04095, partial [Bacteroidales bacterium]|nr:hypothetical protein [Bacteroidales bacterium]
IWIAVDRYGKRFVNFVIGDRSNETAEKFWQAIKHHQMGNVASDYWKAYESIIPKKVHIQTKAATFTVEGYNSNMKLRIILIMNILFFVYLMSFSQNPFLTVLQIHNAKEHEYDTILGISFLKYDSILKEYMVTKIKRTNNAYLIRLTDATTCHYLFTIISLKTKKQEGKKIQKGKQYYFLLYSYYDTNIYRIMEDPVKKQFIINGVSVIFNTDFKTGYIVTTPNLNGLYYTIP